MSTSLQRREPPPEMAMERGRNPTRRQLRSSFPIDQSPEALIDIKYWFVFDSAKAGSLALTGTPEVSTVAMSHGWQEDSGDRRRVARVGVDVRVVRRRSSLESRVGWRRRRRCIGWRRTECRSWRRWRGAHLVGWQSHGRSRRPTRLGGCGRCGRGRRRCRSQRRKPGRSRGSRQRARMRRRARRRQLRAAGMTGRASPIPRCACAKCPIFAMGSTSLVGAAIREAVQQCRSVPKHAPRRRDT